MANWIISKEQERTKRSFRPMVSFFSFSRDVYTSHILAHAPLYKGFPAYLLRLYMYILAYGLMEIQVAILHNTPKVPLQVITVQYFPRGLRCMISCIMKRVELVIKECQIN